ncbi:hypothetical protein B0H16DRAFT_436375 [Mycena metata]|uniref:Uncharacterized protein n=1 Tax=Mycena metata TaxID=1033252 RepID=A0AAD7HCN5_9AGAR|nr:hypothetical protein B0H16DRAFT_436375 [Mycena metata]
MDSERAWACTVAIVFLWPGRWGPKISLAWEVPRNGKTNTLGLFRLVIRNQQSKQLSHGSSSTVQNCTMGSLPLGQTSASSYPVKLITREAPLIL